MNSLKHGPAHAQDFETRTRRNLSWAGSRSNKFQAFDRSPLADGSDNLPKALPTLRHKLYPVRAIPEVAPLLLHFLSLAIQENVNAIHHFCSEIALDGERFG